MNSVKRGLFHIKKDNSQPSIIKIYIPIFFEI
jgi:hypothetical protein